MIKKCKLNFTLAEVLITIGIIGIVSALTIPMLITKYRKAQTISQFKKVYAELNQAFKLSQVDNDDFSGWECGADANSREYVEKYWLPYFKGAKLCESYQECGYSKSQPWLKPDKKKVSYEDVTATEYRYGIQLINGMVISFRIAPVNQNSTAPKINVDLNGSKGPNVSGTDYFWFIPTENGVVPYGLEKNYETISTNCASRGEYCSAKLIHDNFEIKSDYPYN